MSIEHIDYVQRAVALREDKSCHHNCAQAVLLSFQEEMGIPPEQLMALGSNFGLGMGCKSTCGVVTGAVMTLGALGYGKAVSQQFLQSFTEEFSSLDCRDLLQLRSQGGASCDQLICSGVERIGDILTETGEQESS